MTKKILGFFVLSIIFILGACSGGSDENKDATNDPTKTDNNDELFKIGMVTDIGGVHDGSFNESAWNGLEQVRDELGAKIDYLESQDHSNYVTNLSHFAEQGSDITWGVGFLLNDAITEVSQSFPESTFGIIDSKVDAPNVKSVLFEEHQAGYLVGVVAGLKTETNKIGYVGGMEAVPAVKKYETGFVEGVKAVNPEAELFIEYTESFDSPALGKEAAVKLFNQNADIIFHASGLTGKGVFQHAKSLFDEGKQVWVIGVDKDQAKTFGHDITLTSAVKKVDEAIYQTSKDIQEGKNVPQTVILGLSDGGVGLPDENPNLSQSILDEVESYKQKIINGEIIVPEGI